MNFLQQFFGTMGASQFKISQNSAQFGFQHLNFRSRFDHQRFLRSFNRALLVEQNLQCRDVLLKQDNQEGAKNQKHAQAYLFCQSQSFLLNFGLCNTFRKQI